MVRRMGIEPMTPRLKVECSTTELSAHISLLTLLADETHTSRKQLRTTTQLVTTGKLSSSTYVTIRRGFFIFILKSSALTCSFTEVRTTKSLPLLKIIERGLVLRSGLEPESIGYKPIALTIELTQYMVSEFGVAPNKLTVA